MIVNPENEPEICASKSTSRTRLMPLAPRTTVRPCYGFTSFLERFCTSFLDPVFLVVLDGRREAA